MTRWFCNCLGALVLLSGAPISVVPARAQSPGNLAATAVSNGVPAKLMPPVLHSPVYFFRQLLAKEPDERNKVLAERSPESRRLILAKLKEYEALTPEERELRLEVTELHWYLWPLMNAPSTNRPAQLALIPPEFRGLIRARLELWDILPPGLQKEVLENDEAVRIFSSPPEERDRLIARLPPARRAKLEQGIKDWQALTDNERAGIINRVNQFFDLTPQEKRKTLATLSEPERDQMEKTLKEFQGLSPAQRSQCWRSFQQFACMTLAQRQQFLKNAERWEQMTPTQRQAWKDLIYNLSRQPPLPPGVGLPPLPPAPPRLSSLPPPFQREPKVAATNGN